MRKDLYEGKYAPDMQAWKKFDEIMKLPPQLSEEEEKKRIEEINMKSEKEELWFPYICSFLNCDNMFLQK